jgi:hypothetical protein
MDRMAGHKHSLVQILQGAAGDPAAFDPTEAGLAIERVAFGLFGLAPRKPKPVRRETQARKLAQELDTLQRQRRQLTKRRWTSRGINPVVSAVETLGLGLSPEEEIDAKLRGSQRALRDIAKPAKAGRPKGSSHQATIRATVFCLALVYRKYTGKKPSGPTWDDYGDGRRIDTPFSRLVGEFLAMYGRKRLGVERVNQIVRDARKASPTCFN